MSRLLVLSALLPGVVFLAGPGREPPAPAPELVAPPVPLELAHAPVERLIAQLGHRDFRVREAADRALRVRGPAALPAVRSALRHADPEVRRRLEALLRRTASAELTRAKRVTLRGRKLPLAEALGQLTAQTDYPIEVEDDADDKTVTLNLVDVPFWEALDRLCLSAGLTFQGEPGDPHIVLEGRAEAEFVPFVSYRGPFRFRAVGFDLQRSVAFGTLPAVPGPNPLQREGTLVFQFDLSAEPRLPLFRVGQPVVTEAIDDRGVSLLPNLEEGAEPEDDPAEKQPALTVPLKLDLSPPDRTAQRLKVLKGTVLVTLLAERRPLLAIEPILGAKNRQAKAGGVRLRVREVRETEEKEYDIDLEMSRQRRRAGAEDGEAESWVDHHAQRLALLDARGNAYILDGFTADLTKADSVKGTLTFRPSGNLTLGPPVRLVYHEWVKADHVIPFEFTNLPLP